MPMMQPSDLISTGTKAFEASKKLPTLPIPPLEDTCRRYLRALEGLQEPDEHARTKQAVEKFLNGDGPRIQERLKRWAANKAR
jgi:carnitine O-acetyltransferase